MLQSQKSLKLPLQGGRGITAAEVRSITRRWSRNVTCFNEAAALLPRKLFFSMPQLDSASLALQGGRGITAAEVYRPH